MTDETIEPIDKPTNGKVTVTLEISDPVSQLGVETRLLEFESEKSFVSKRLADHIWNELLIDVEDHGVEVKST